MNLEPYINIIESIIVWVVALILWRKHIIKLWPIALMSAIILFGVELYGASLQLFHFSEKSFFPIGKVPLFHIIWGSGSGLVLAYFIKQCFTHNFIVTVVFTVFSVLFGWVAEKTNNHIHSAYFTVAHNAVLDFGIILLLICLTRELFGHLIYPKKKYKTIY